MAESRDICLVDSVGITQEGGVLVRDHDSASNGDHGCSVAWWITVGEHPSTNTFWSLFMEDSLMNTPQPIAYQEFLAQSVAHSDRVHYHRVVGDGLTGRSIL